MLYLDFSPFDCPTQLTKVGNWVFTFISSKEDVQHTLAMTNVIPRQVDHHIEIRRMLIQQTSVENRWEILTIEAFNGTINQELILNVSSHETIELIKEILKEFNRYDVEIHLTSCNELKS